MTSKYLDYLESKGRKRYIPDGESNNPLLVRYLPLFNDKMLNAETDKKVSKFNIFIHNLRRPDLDDLHDHPWWYVTIVLRGGYIEETPNGRFERKPGYIGLYRPTSLHRIVPNPNCWTLFIRGPEIRKWGFVKNGKWIYHRDYTNGNF